MPQLNFQQHCLYCPGNNINDDREGLGGGEHVMPHEFLLGAFA